jgi:phenylacetate-CoA ligase
MGPYFDALETRSVDERENALMAAISRQIAHAKAHTVAFAEILADVDSAAVSSRAALKALPVTRKHSDFIERQARNRATADVFGGYAAVGWSGPQVSARARRVFQSPGPIYEPEGNSRDFERVARAMFAAGFRRGELVHNSFSYHLTPAGAMAESAALALGCTVFPAGVGNTDLQLRAIADLLPSCYVGSPAFLRALIEKGAENGLLTRSLQRALVSGEPFPPVARAWLEERGVKAFQAFMTADVGLIAYETEAREGMVIDENIIIEIVRPGTGDPVQEGEVGELVVTSLNPDYPLIRFGTGDLSAVLPGFCPTGRTNQRIKGWMGRADQTAKVRGLFVHTSQIAEIMRRHSEIGRARLVIRGGVSDGILQPDEIVLQAESATQSQDLVRSIASSVRDVTRLRSGVELCAIGSLPNDGKLIDDQRRLESPR